MVAPVTAAVEFNRGGRRPLARSRSPLSCAIWRSPTWPAAGLQYRAQYGGPTWCVGEERVALPQQVGRPLYPVRYNEHHRCM